MNIQAIKVTQPLGEFYLAKIKAEDLLRISTSAVARYDKNGVLRGNQRPIKPNRLKEIAKFIQSKEMCFPSSIIVAANVDENGLISDDENDKRWSVSLMPNMTDVYELRIPDNGISALIIDGQHRLNAFNEESLNGEHRDIELVCSVFFDLPSSYQAYLFATINGNQKRVDKSLALELFGINLENEPQNTWSPEKLAVFLTRKFNFSNDSPLRNKIRLAPLRDNDIQNNSYFLSTAAMVEGITKLISSNPQRDRDELARKKNYWWEDGTRKMLNNVRADNTVLRQLYIKSEDDKIYTILYKFFSSVKTILWDNAPQNSIILKTIGISVLFNILKEILIRDKEQESYDDYINKIKDIDYTHNYFSLSGIGKTRLKRILKYKIGVLPESELMPEDFEVLNG